MLLYIPYSTGIFYRSLKSHTSSVKPDTGAQKAKNEFGFRYSPFYRILGYQPIFLNYRYANTSFMHVKNVKSDTGLKEVCFFYGTSHFVGIYGTTFLARFN